MKLLLTFLVLGMLGFGCSSCEKVELTENPGPWIFLEKPFTTGEYVTSEDTVVKPFDYNHLFWIGDVAPHIFAANGIKEVSITVNGSPYELYGDFSPSYDCYHFLQYVDVRVDATNPDCLIIIKATDNKGLTAEKRVKIRYSVTGV